MVLERRGVQETWLVFKEHLLQSQEWFMPISRKSNKGGRRPTPKTKMLLTKLKCKNEAYKRWQQDHAAQEEYKDTVQVCGNDVQKAKAHLELNMARDVNGNQKSFYRYMSSKTTTRETWPLS